MTHGWLTDLKLALRNVLRHRRRSAMGVSAVAFGVVAVILANSFIDWALWAMRETTIRSQFGHVQVARKGYADAGAAEPDKFLIDENAPERQQLRALPYVRVVAPRVSFSGLLAFSDSTVSFIGEGVDPVDEAAMQSSLRLPRAAINIAQGEDLSSDEPMGFVLGEGLAQSIGARVNDKVVLLVNTPGGGVNGIEGRVRGVFSTITKAFDDSALRVNRSAAHTLLRSTGDHRLVVLIERTEDTPGAVSDLQRRFAANGLEFTPWSELADFYNKSAALFSKQTRFVALVIAFIIVLSIMNIMTMSVLERTGEIGTAMALGVPRARILRQFLLEGLLLGTAGGALGVLVGALLANWISTIGIPMPPPPGQSWGYRGQMLLSAPTLLQAFVLALLTTLAASLYPAYKASRQVIVDALRTNR